MLFNTLLLLIGLTVDYLHGRTLALTNLPEEVRLKAHSHRISSRNILTLSSLLLLSRSLLFLSLCLLSLTSLGSSRGSLLGISFFSRPRLWSFIWQLGGSFPTSPMASFTTAELAKSARTPMGRLIKCFTQIRPLVRGEALVQ